MKKYLILLIPFILCSCETQERDGHVYIHNKWVHDPDCGKCKELEIEKQEKLLNK